MTDPTPYVHFPGTAREALTSHGEVFGCTVQLHTFAEFGRNDGPAGAIAHGYLTGGPVGQLEDLVPAGGQAGMEIQPEPRQHGGWPGTDGICQAIHHGLRS